MKKKITLSSAISYVFVAMTVTFCLTMIVSSKMFTAKVESVNEKEAMYEKVSDIDQTVRQNYYTNIDDTRILEKMSAGYVRGLGDADSRYYTATEVAEYQLVMDGKIIGIGLDFIKSKEDSGYMKIYKVYHDSPADVQGIVAGDKITAINGVSTINMSLETAQAMLAGVSGATVDITYIHESTETTATLVHKAYDAPSTSYVKEDDYGYIRITTFSKRTASELDYAVKNLTDAGATSLVIDLRDTFSKDFDSAAAAADVLLKEGTTMYAQYKEGEPKVLYTSDKTSTSLPIVIITNSRTSYASEMFIVMLKDIAGAKTVGTTTMGKGTLQKMFRLPDGSGVELTTAVLKPISSGSYHGVGIVPDYEKDLDPTVESFHTLSIEADTQIQRAFEVAKNIVNNNAAVAPEATPEATPEVTPDETPAESESEE